MTDDKIGYRVLSICSPINNVDHVRWIVAVRQYNFRSHGLTEAEETRLEMDKF